MSVPPARVHRREVFDPVVTWRGAWVGVTNYVPGDKVSLRGAVYTCIRAHSGQVPPNVTYWQGETWTAPTLINSWADYLSFWAPSGYVRDNGGFVHLKGLVKNGAIGTVIFTLPAGFRPFDQHLFAAIGDNGIARVDVYPNGSVVYNTGPGNPAGFLQLSGITFMAEV